MTDMTPAKLVYLTAPEVAPVLNVQTEQDELIRFVLTKDQLFQLNAQSANLLLKDRK